MIIVTDPNEAALQASGDAAAARRRRKPIVLSDITVCKAPGSTSATDRSTYDDTTPAARWDRPWAGGAANTLPQQAAPTTKNLCEGPAADGRPDPIDEDGTPHGTAATGDIPNIQTERLTPARDQRGPDGAHQRQERRRARRRPGLRRHAPGALGRRRVHARRAGPARGCACRSSTRRRPATSACASPDRRGRTGARWSGSAARAACSTAPSPRAACSGQPVRHQVHGAGEILLPPGSRADVVAAIPTAATVGA